MSPTFSVIIPAYNNAEFLGDAIGSALNQTHRDLEVIVVNDASPQDISPVMAQFQDPRLKYIVHAQNRGLAAARNSGMRSSVGQYIALLDGDDYFHPQKLKCHAEFLSAHPEVGVTYNPRFELNHSASTIRELWRPPLAVTLADMILGFPFGPSDMVIQRDWAFKVDLFDEKYTYFGEDLDLNCRLALAGCQFRSVDRALNYRRYHAGRRIANLSGYHQAEMESLLKVFTDPRCPPDVGALYNKAVASRYVGWTYTAYAQDETGLGEECCLKAIGLDPAVVAGNPCPLVEALITFSILEESRDHEALLREIFDHLAPRVAALGAQADWAIGRGYLLKGTRAIMWGRITEGRHYLASAAAAGANLDKPLVQKLTAQLLDIDRELGHQAADDAIGNLAPQLERLGSRSSVRGLIGSYALNRAFENYRAQRYRAAVMDALRAIATDPHYIGNRGVYSILLRSAWAMVKRAGRHAQRRPARAQA
jgi:Glycosyl transferase family 2